MSGLSSIERQALIDMLGEQHGWSLSCAHFAELALCLFEDISGLEHLPSDKAAQLSYQLWKIYREQKDHH